MYVARRDMIMSYIQDEGQVRLKELESLFPDVSTMTLRRDLIYLEEQGELIRVRGGAKLAKTKEEKVERVYSKRALTNTDAKNKIAKKAVKYVEERRSIYIDSGTTMMSLAEIVPNDEISVITSGPNIALEISKNSKPSVTLIGGQLNRNNLCTSGLYALDFIRDINIDIAFIAASGFSLDSGFTCGDFNEYELKKTIVNKARYKILLMDSSKLDKSLPYTFARLSDIDIFITDKELSEEIKKAAASASVSII